MIASVADSKSDLRMQIRAARSTAVRDPDAGQEPTGFLATARAAGLLNADGTPDLLGPVAIAAYIASPGEPDVAAIRAAVRAAGGVVLLPIPRADRTMDWAFDDGRYQPEGRYPIEIPAGEVVGSGVAGLLAHGVRTILVPALAVDAAGARLGQGGGYYDRLLSDLRARTGAAWDGIEPDVLRPATAVVVVAVVHDAELLPAGAVPREAHDQAMAAALTPTRYVALEP